MGQKRYSLRGRRGNRNKEGKRGRKQGREGERVKGKKEERLHRQDGRWDKKNGARMSEEMRE